MTDTLPDIRRVDDRVSVAPQVTPAMMDAIRAAGFVAIVNNRPDAEEPGQPSGADIQAAAARAGLAYHEVPVTQAGFSHPQLDAMAQVLATAGGPVLAFCRSGTRSCNLWALASARAGGDPATLVAQAAAAGYDLRGIRPTLDALAAG
jgi:uncharacterized protein (TIGR01244 family)